MSPLHSSSRPAEFQPCTRVSVRLHLMNIDLDYFAIHSTVVLYDNYLTALLVKPVVRVHPPTHITHLALFNSLIFISFMRALV